MDGAELRRPGGVFLLDPLVPLRDVLLVVHPREVAHATQPLLQPIPQGIVPAIDPAANVAQLLVGSPRVLRAVGACEAMPANGTPSGVLVVAVLSNAPHTLEARQESRKLDPQPCADSGEELIRGHLQSFTGKLRSAGGLGQEKVPRVLTAAAVGLGDLGAGWVLEPQRGVQLLLLGGVLLLLLILSLLRLLLLLSSGVLLLFLLLSSSRLLLLLKSRLRLLLRRSSRLLLLLFKSSRLRLLLFKSLSLLLFLSAGFSSSSSSSESFALR